MPNRTEVVNLDRKDLFDEYCGRPGKGLPGPFGNLVASETRNRYENVEAFRSYFYDRIEKDAEYKEAVMRLKGKRLACFCAPLLCHVMVIVEYLEGVTPADQIQDYLNWYVRKSPKPPKPAKQEKWLEPDLFEE